MLLRLCQLKSLPILLLLATQMSCTLRRDDSASSELLTTIPNRWFSVNKNHSLLTTNGEPSSHLLFDTTPGFNNDNREVNVVIITPEDSQHAYAVDLNSGKRFYSHSYCKQSDVWNEYSRTIATPSYSVGYIPRVLDQLGEPQKVIVFSKRNGLYESAGKNFQRVRLVGAYVEQICPDGNCLGKSNWLSRMVFLAVDAEDLHYTKVKTAKDLTHAINWKKAKAALSNLEGRNFIGDVNYPSTRIGELIEYEDAFDFFKKRSIFLSDTELKKIQKGCHTLYDRLWDEVGKVREEDKPARTVEELSKKVKLHESLKKQQLPVGFAARFKIFTKKYFKEISTCEKFVYHGNVNQDREKYWFLSYLGIYYRLHREGYYFDCNRRTWQRNVLDDRGTPVFDITKDINDCKEADIDLAMDYLPNFLAGLKTEKEYFKFIDYDNSTPGTHQKMYSWVKVRNRRFDCKDDPNRKMLKDARLFPEDVTWKVRAVKDIADSMKIIY